MYYQHPLSNTHEKVGKSNDQNKKKFVADPDHCRNCLFEFEYDTTINDSSDGYGIDSDVEMRAPDVGFGVVGW